LGTIAAELKTVTKALESITLAMNEYGKAKKSIRTMPTAAIKKFTAEIILLKAAMKGLPLQIERFGSAMAAAGTTGNAGVSSKYGMSVKKMQDAFAGINAQMMGMVQTFHAARDAISGTAKSFDKQTQTVAQAGKEYDRVANSTKSAAKAQQEVASVSERAAAAIGAVGDEAGKAGKKTETFARGTTAGFKNMLLSQAAFMAGFAVLFVPLFKFIEIIKDSVNIQNEFARVLRVLKSNISSMGKVSADAFTAMNLEMIRTGESSKTVAEVLYQLGSAGLSAEEAIAALSTTMDVLVGTEADVTTLTKTIAGVYNNLKDQIYKTADGLVVFRTEAQAQGEQLSRNVTLTEKFTAINDVLVQAFRDSQVEMSELNDGLKYSISTANVVGISFTELVSILAILNDRMIKAGTAGRSFQTMLAQMAKSPKNVEKAFGIVIDPTKAINMMDILKQLNEKWYQSGKGAKDASITVEKLGQSFKSMNLRGAKAFIVLVKYYNDLIAYNIKLEQASVRAASKMAQIMLDRPEAALKRLYQSFVVLTNFTFGPLIAALLGIVKAINAVVYAVAKLISILPDSVQWVLKLAAAFAGLKIVTGIMGLLMGQFKVLERVVFMVVNALILLPQAIKAQGIVSAFGLATGAAKSYEKGIMTAAIAQGAFSAVATQSVARVGLLTRVYKETSTALQILFKWLVAMGGAIAVAINSAVIGQFTLLGTKIKDASKWLFLFAGKLASMSGKAVMAIGTAFTLLGAKIKDALKLVALFATSLATGGLSGAMASLRAFGNMLAGATFATTFVGLSSLITGFKQLPAVISKAGNAIKFLYENSKVLVGTIWEVIKYIGPAGIAGVVALAAAAIGLLVYGIYKLHESFIKSNELMWKQYRYLQYLTDGNKELAAGLATQAIKAQGVVIEDTSRKINVMLNNLTGFRGVAGGFRGLYTPIADLRKETQLLIRAQQTQINTIAEVRQTYDEASVEYKALDDLYKKSTATLDKQRSAFAGLSKESYTLFDSLKLGINILQSAFGSFGDILLQWATGIVNSIVFIVDSMLSAITKGINMAVFVVDKFLKLIGKKTVTEKADEWINSKKAEQNALDTVRAYQEIEDYIARNPLLFGIEVDQAGFEKAGKDMFQYIYQNLDKSVTGITQNLGEQFAINDKILEQYLDQIDAQKQLLLNEDARGKNNEKVPEILKGITSLFDEMNSKSLKRLELENNILEATGKIKRTYSEIGFAKSFIKMSKAGTDSFAKLEKAAINFNHNLEVAEQQRTANEITNMAKYFEALSTNQRATLAMMEPLYNKIAEKGVAAIGKVKDKILELGNAILESQRKISAMSLELAEMGATKFEGLASLRDVFGIGAGSAEKLADSINTAKDKVTSLRDKMDELDEKNAAIIKADGYTKEYYKSLSELSKTQQEYNEQSKELANLEARKGMLYAENTAMLNDQVRSYDEVMNTAMRMAMEEARMADQAGNNTAKRDEALKLQKDQLAKYIEYMNKAAQAENQIIDVAVGVGVKTREQGEAEKYQLFNKYQNMYLAAYGKQENVQRQLIENERARQEELVGYQQQQVQILSNLQTIMLKVVEVMGKFFDSEQVVKWAQDAEVSFGKVNDSLSNTTSEVGKLKNATTDASKTASKLGESFAAKEMADSFVTLTAGGITYLTSVKDLFGALNGQIDLSRENITAFARDMFSIPKDIPIDIKGLDQGTQKMDTFGVKTDEAKQQVDGVTGKLDEVYTAAEKISDPLVDFSQGIDMALLGVQGLGDELRRIFDQKYKLNIDTGQIEFPRLHRGGQVKSVLAKVSAGEGFVPASFARNNPSLLNTLNAGVPIRGAGRIPVGTFRGPAGVDQIPTALPESSYVLSLRGMKALQRSMDMQPRKFKEGGLVENTSLGMPAATTEEDKAMFELKLQVGKEERTYPLYGSRSQVKEIKELLEREKRTQL
jgi:TP901 family phage tail tape measure protein